MGFLLFFKLGEGPEAPQAASSDDDRSMSSDESELESDEEEREKRLYVVAVFFLGEWYNTKSCICVLKLRNFSQKVCSTPITWAICWLGDQSDGL